MAGFMNAIDLNREQYWNVQSFQFMGQRNGLRSAPTVAIDDDAGLFFLAGRKDAISVGIQQLHHPAKGALPLVVRKHFGMDDRGISLTKIFSKLHFRMVHVIAPHEPSNKTDNNGVPGIAASAPAMLPKADSAESCFDTCRWHGLTAGSSV